MPRHFWICALLLSLLSGCSTSDTDSRNFSRRSLPILNGERVTGDAFLSTVGLSNELNEGENALYCTGTLIAPQYVLTAAHCVTDCDDGSASIQDMVNKLVIIIGQSGQTFRDSYQVDEIYSHPEFVCKTNEMKNDIAIIKLKMPVITENVVPTPPLPPSLALTPKDIDDDKIQGTVVGFGRTDPALEYTNGSKYRFTSSIYALCTLSGQKSQLCGEKYTNFSGYFYFQVSDELPGTCTGDSGGPTFITRGETQFVAGVTSFGYDNCQYASSMTNVSDYYDFIKQHVPDIIAENEENCYNGIDDNADGRTDCDDPYCMSGTACIPEDCTNQKDDNHNGLTDCDDPQCAKESSCKKEICDNAVDDDENGQTDCEDHACRMFPACRKEICDNDIDDDENGLTDCNDPACLENANCKAEDRPCNSENCEVPPDECSDCEDPGCQSSPECAELLDPPAPVKPPRQDPDSPVPQKNTSSGCSQNTPSDSQPVLFFFLAISGLLLRRRIC